MIIDFNPLKQLSTSELYDSIGQENIYNFYLGERISKDRLYKCLFHKDSNPSMGFYKTAQDNIRYKCFGCGAEGGAITFVMNLLDLKFPLALKRIQKDFNYLKTGTDIKNYHRIHDGIFKESVLDKLKIIPVYRSYSLEDVQYWGRFGLNLNDILKAGIRACKEVYYTNKDGQTKLYANHNKGNPIYCIEISKDIYKIYRPLNPNKTGKWFTNSSSEDIQGMKLLSDKRSLLLVTSSMKDAIVLGKLGYEAVAPSGEGVRIPDSVWNYLEATSDRIIFFNDSDEAGYKYTLKLATEKNCSYIFIPENYKVKDISDFVEKYGLKKAEELMNNLLKEWL